MIQVTQRGRKTISIRILLREDEIKDAADIDIAIEIDKLVMRTPEDSACDEYNVRRVQRELCLINATLAANSIGGLVYAIAFG